MGSYPLVYSLSLDESETGTLKTDRPHVVSSIKDNNNVRIDVQLLNEVHGSFDVGGDNDGSLLVVRLVPFPDTPNFHYSDLTVTLYVESETTSDTNSSAAIISYEPAIDGEVFVEGQDVTITNTTTDSNMVGLSLGYDPASLEVQKTRENFKQFDRTRRLRIRDGGAGGAGSKQYARWVINAADKIEGIGDSFTVAILVQRSPNSKFILSAQARGDAGAFELVRGKATRALSMFRRDKEKVIVLPTPYHEKSPVPLGVTRDNLHKSSTRGTMKAIVSAGVHVAESAKAHRMTNPGWKRRNRRRGEEGTEADESGELDESVEKDEAAVAENAAGSDSIADAQGTKATQASQTVDQSTLAGSEEGSRPMPRIVRPKSDAVLLAAILKELKELRILTDRQNSASAVKRVILLRETARMHEELAQHCYQEAHELEEYLAD